MRWAIGALLALGFSLAASAALACPYPHGCRPDAAYEGQAVDSANDIFDARRYDQGGNLYTDDRYGPGYDEPYDDAGPWASPWYRDGRRPAPPCGCGQVRLSSSFFHDAGGVGPIPMGGYDGGVWYVSRGSGFGASSAQAFASASARAHVNVSVRGGGHGKHR